MSQPNHHSIAEAVANTASGMIVSFVAAYYVFPMVGVAINAGQNAVLTVVFTLISLIRTYAFRRLFNRLHQQGWWQ
jgi:ABC-type spermidine/putrescine transport system permease subunit I